ncbi:prolyl 4-hydroxylase subunit alpha-1-like [Actinia tenebrosa]|uniref:procollagen-proline 4-dioxygenase n=1 Tax=Actinia tenebrosa TaxID=6105 RepID=A0A6P8H957_ACTTE|nr:prolyl 4-hydroxylase subunit alpha-1-like [Actinia tenebrosa]
MGRKLVQILVVFGVIPIVISEVYTALTHMKGLIRMEKTLTRELEHFLASHPKAPAEFHRLAIEVKTQTSDIKNDLERFLGHPLNAFLLIRRYRKQWKELEEYLRKNDDESDLFQILEAFSTGFPTDEDVLGCVRAIMRIQEVYRISAKQIADGKLSNKTVTPQLNAEHCFEIGFAYYQWENYAQAYGWLIEGMTRLEKPFEYNGPLRRVQVLEFLSWTEYMTDRLIDALKHALELLQLDPENDYAGRNIEFLTNEVQKANEKGGPYVRQEAFFKKPRKKKEEYMKVYERLCRGISLKSQAQLGRLKCYYETKLHPMLKLRPLKVEMINEDPYIVMLRDVMYDHEIEYIKKTAAPLLNRATVTNSETGDLEFADYRVSKSGWLEDFTHDNDEGILKRINRRTSIITGLKTDNTSAEALQIVNYGTAGHYEPHFDHATEPYSAIMRLGMGNRIATLLFYMSDVESGGSTVFIETEAIARPSKGDAVFWYNLRKSGEGDSLTQHAGCPVVVGSKWVCNKWIHEMGQEFRRPCDLTIDE